MDGWALQWSRAGDVHLSRADSELEADHFAEAGQCYRAAADNYLRALSDRELGRAERQRLEQAHENARHAAIQLLSQPTELDQRT